MTLLLWISEQIKNVLSEGNYVKDFKNRGGLIRREDVKEMSTQHNFFLTIILLMLSST